MRSTSPSRHAASLASSSARGSNGASPPRVPIAGQFGSADPLDIHRPSFLLDRHSAALIQPNGWRVVLFDVEVPPRAGFRCDALANFTHQGATAAALLDVGIDDDVDYVRRPSVKAPRCVSDGRLP